MPNRMRQRTRSVTRSSTAGHTKRRSTLLIVPAQSSPPTNTPAISQNFDCKVQARLTSELIASHCQAIALPWQSDGGRRQIPRKMDLGCGVFDSRREGCAEIQGLHSSADFRGE